ncbi:MAG: ribonuclease J [Anaerolineae bacterium]|nr:ribonuclease J [Anaerolineae bacterium]MCO5203421.1 ribonuclease J [Anaerolineae bacterium]
MSSKLRILPLGGCGEIGKNMTVIEYENEILIVDAGIMFPENDMLGVDAIIPDYSYLNDKMDKVKGVLITHGHEDHVGALPHLMRDVKAPLYATPLTLGLIEVKLQRAGLRQNVQLREIQAGDAFAVGRFMIEPFHVTHSIPDCVGFGITTPVGLIVHTGDYKFDHTPEDDWPPDFAKLAEFSARNVLCLLGDSTNAERPGWTPSERVIVEAFDELFSQAEGRIIVASFASLISRVKQVAEAAERHGRRLAIAGRSMRDNIKMAQRLGYLDLPEGLLIDIDQANNLPAHKVAIMATGSQGEPTSVLGRMARGRHNQLRVREGDTIVISAHTIPGNEEMTHRIINRMFQQGASVLYEGNAHVHVSGHGAREEMKLMINLIRPKYFIPVHGELRHLTAHRKMVIELGIPDEHIAVVENGHVVEFTPNSMKVLDRLPGGYVFVQGSAVGDIGFPIVRERDELAQAGFYTAVVRLNDNADLLTAPKIVSEGFMSKSNVEELYEGACEIIANTASQYGMKSRHLDSQIQGALKRYLYAETGLRPRVFVVIN